MTVIAATTSRRGGRLDCGHRARPGQQIFKIDTGERGGQTSAGNGLGQWVCATCAAAADRPD
jgi:hypothetical protein